MKLWHERTPSMDLTPEELREALREAMGPVPRFPIYSNAGLAVRVRFVYELPPGPLEVRPELPPFPNVSTLAWYWLAALEGLLWESAGQVVQLTTRKEWGRVAGVEVNV